MAASSCVQEPLQETDRNSSTAVPRMEPLWSRVVANGGNRRQIEEPRKPQKRAKTVATGCHPLPEKFHGKQGVCRELPPVAGGPPCGGGGRFCRRCGGALRQPLARHVHCCTIMQDLIIARARQTDRCAEEGRRTTVRRAAKHTSA